MQGAIHARSFPAEELRESVTVDAKAMRTLFDEKKIADGQGVDAGAIKAADGLARIGNKRLAEEIEGGVEEDRGGRALAEFVEQAPEARIGLTFDSVNANLATFEGKAFESGGHIGFEGAERSHEAAIGRAIEESRNSFSGGRKGERVEVLAMLDVLVHIFDDVLGKRGSENAAIAEGTMPEFGTALEPGHNFVAQEELRDFCEKRFLA